MTKRIATVQKNRVARAQARKLLASPDFFNRYLATLKKAGLVGERRNALVLLLVVISRLLLRPLSTLVKGKSASGKNRLATFVFLLVPRGRVREISTASDKAWHYSRDHFRHKVLYLQEQSAAGASVRGIRLLISEGKLIRIVTQWIDGKRLTKRYVARGPVASISTTTKSALEIDDESRHLSILIDESPEQTRRIVRAYSRQASALPENELLVWQMVHRLIEQRADLEIVFPEWFDVVADSVYVEDVLVRRYYPAFVEACRVVSLIRSFQRDRRQTADGRLELDFSDFAIAALILDRIFVESLKLEKDSALEVRNVVREISDSKNGQPVQAPDLAEALGISLDRAYEQLRDAAAVGAIRRANAPEKDNRKLYLPAPRRRFIPDPEKLFQKVTGIEDSVRFVHPFTGDWVVYSRKNRKPQARKQID